MNTIAAHSCLLLMLTCIVYCVNKKKTLHSNTTTLTHKSYFHMMQSDCWHRSIYCVSFISSCFNWWPKEKKKNMHNFKLRHTFTLALDSNGPAHNRGHKSTRYVRGAVDAESFFCFKARAIGALPIVVWVLMLFDSRNYLRLSCALQN